jgi:hypothetical protein
VICGQCGGSDQVVATQDGNFCRNCYRGYKAGKSMGRVSDSSEPLPRTVTCGNCFVEVAKGADRCFMCGEHLNQDGSVLRIGGHPNC